MHLNVQLFLSMKDSYNELYSGVNVHLSEGWQGARRRRRSRGAAVSRGPYTVSSALDSSAGTGSVSAQHTSHHVTSRHVTSRHVTAGRYAQPGAWRGTHRRGARRAGGTARRRTRRTASRSTLSRCHVTARTLYNEQKR